MTSNRIAEIKDVVPEISTYKDSKIEYEEEDKDLEQHLQEFNKKVDSIEKEIEQVSDFITKIKELHVKAISATLATERKELKEQLNKQITSTGLKNKDIQKDLETLNKSTQDRKKELENKNTAEIRIREMKHVTLVKDFQKVIQDYQEMQAEYRKLYSDRAKRTCKITNPKLTDEEVEQLVENNQIDEDAYKKKILTRSQQATLDTYYDEAIETRRDVLMLEASLIELQEMFVAMAQLVAQQDDLIENIENNVISADEFVKKGIQHTQDARSYGDKSRIIMIIIFIIIIIIVITLIIIIGGITVPIVLKALNKI